MIRSLFVLALAGCNFDAEVGRNTLLAGDASEPPPDAATIRQLFYGGWGSIFVEDAALIVLGSVHPEPGVVQGSTGGILRLQPDGTIEVLAEADDGARTMVADATHFYVASQATVVRIDRATLAATEIVSGPHSIASIAIDDEWLFVAEHRTGHDEYGTTYPDSRLARFRKDGTARRDLLSGLDTPAGLAVDGDFVYLAEDMGGKIHAAPTSGCRPIELAVGVNRPSHVHIVGPWVYFTERGGTQTDGTIARVPKPIQPCAPHQTVPFETLVTGLGFPSHLVADSTHVYWSGYFSGMQRAVIDGGAAESLYDCFGRPHPGVQLSQYVQGCGPFAVLGNELFFSARDPEHHSTAYAGLR